MKMMINEEKSVEKRDGDLVDDDKMVVDNC